jgi:hypothetical protein
VPKRDEPKLVYSTDRVAIVRAARASGFNNELILLALTENEYGRSARIRIIKDCASALSLTEAEALAVARRLGIIK